MPLVDEGSEPEDEEDEQMVNKAFGKLGQTGQATLAAGKCLLFGGSVSGEDRPGGWRVCFGHQLWRGTGRGCDGAHPLLDPQSRTRETLKHLTAWSGALSRGAHKQFLWCSPSFIERGLDPCKVGPVTSFPPT